MAGVKDFRESTFSRSRVEVCGRYLGHKSYWKLYAIENYLRVIMHSVLVAQVPAPWWDNAVDKKLRKRVAVVKQSYTVKPFHTSPGKHDIYYVFLPDLNKIILANSNLFRSDIPDIDMWIPKLEDIQTPRNLVGHMNYPNLGDRQRIDKVHSELAGLMERLERSNLDIKIP